MIDRFAGRAKRHESYRRLVPLGPPHGGRSDGRSGTAGAELRRLALRERADELVVEVVELLGDGRGDAFVVHLAAAVDVVLEPLVEVEVLPALGDGLFVVELDLGDEEPSEAARV